MSVSSELCHARLEDAHWIERGAILYLMIFTTFPVIILALAYGLPKSDRQENFGHGNINHKAIILLIGSCICILIAGFKAERRVPHAWIYWESVHEHHGMPLRLRPAWKHAVQGMAESMGILAECEGCWKQVAEGAGLVCRGLARHG